MRVYALADMFFLDGLKDLSTAKLQQRLQCNWNSATFPDCAREVYACTRESDREIRSAVANAARIHAQQLWNSAGFKDLIREGGDFAVDFAAPAIRSSHSNLSPYGSLQAIVPARTVSGFDMDN